MDLFPTPSRLTIRLVTPHEGVQWSARRRQQELAYPQQRELAYPQPSRIACGRRFFLRLGLQLLSQATKWSGASRRGFRNAKQIRRRHLTLTFPGLPPAFDGLTLLHLSDFHFGQFPAIDAAIVDALRGASADLCVMTGDFQASKARDDDQLRRRLGETVAAIDVFGGLMATLGNHDNASIAGFLTRLGVRVLVNQEIEVRRGGEVLSIVGLDDVRAFHGPQTFKALLGAARDRFRIALVHSAEAAHPAAEAGYDLYLCGHTHGGQVCLPGGRPLVTGLRRGTRFAKGLWRCGAMTGFTTNGLGCSHLPLRFAAPPEIVHITLRRLEPNRQPTFPERLGQTI